MICDFFEIYGTLVIRSNTLVGLTNRAECERVEVAELLASRVAIAEMWQMPNKDQRRRWDRYNVMFSVNVTMVEDGKRITLSGQASDISKGGLRLFVTRTVEVGASLSLQFLLPYYSTELEIKGVVRSRDGFTYGVEFLNPTGEQQHIIERTCDVFSLLR